MFWNKKKKSIMPANKRFMNNPVTIRQVFSND